MTADTVKTRRTAPLRTPTNLGSNATKDISAALNALLADMFALYLKTKNFHWHVSGPHFRDYHLMFDEQGEQIFATTDDIAERVRKIGGTTIRSIGQISKLQRVQDNDADFVTPEDMLAELRSDNQDLAQRLREVHDTCDEHGDVATASLIENWIDQAERRTWFLFEAGRRDLTADGPLTHRTSGPDHSSVTRWRRTCAQRMADVRVVRLIALPASHVTSRRVHRATASQIGGRRKAATEKSIRHFGVVPDSDRAQRLPVSASSTLAAAQRRRSRDDCRAASIRPTSRRILDPAFAQPSACQPRAAGETPEPIQRCWRP